MSSRYIHNYTDLQFEFIYKVHFKEKQKKIIYIVGYTVVRETVGCVKQIAAVVIISPMEEDKMLSCSLDVIVIFLKSS